MSRVNHQVRLAARPTGTPGPECWSHTEEPVPDLGDGRSYLPPVGIGEVMRAGGAGRVVTSRHPRFPEGTAVTGLFGVQDFAVSDGSGVVTVDPELAPLPTHLGVIGMPGMTAYFGLLEVGQARQGETVVVSGAAGAVGTVVGQIAKIKGCRVVGIAGGPDKCAWLTGDLGFDAAIDYKSDDVRRALREHAPDGIDVYFDNVGGPILDAALSQLARHARVVICGAISQYNNETGPTGPANYLSLLVNRARMEGFVVFDYADRYGEAAEELGGWLKARQLVAREDVVRGSVGDFPAVLLRLFSGANTGKLVLALR